MLNHNFNRLKQQFPPNDQLAFDDFICDDIVEFYYGDRAKITKIFNLLSCRWIDIQWDEITEIGFDDNDTYPLGHIVTTRLNKQSYIHVFPSLLMYIINCSYDKSKSIEIANYFIQTHLDLRSISKDWEMEYYFSFDQNKVRLIHDILKDYPAPWAEDAIDVYWHE